MDILDFFTFEAAGMSIDELETPVPVIDIDIVDRNLRRWQERCDAIGIANRPHIKTHKLAALARYQIALGARGITVQKLGEAEVMADAGIDDLLLTFNIVGASKLRRLAALAKRVKMTVVADNSVVIKGLGEAGRMAGVDIGVLVECDTGAKRNGAQSPEEALALAREIDATPGIAYKGLMTYPAPGMRRRMADFLVKARDLIDAAGLKTEVISIGGTPDMWSDEGIDVGTEYRAGTYIYCDRAEMAAGACDWDDCAFTVLSTVVSVPTADRALIDAGSKTLTMDLLGLEGYGVVHALGDAPVYAVNEEHGYLDISKLADKPAVGDLVRITPNHVCPVSNLFDRVVFIRGDKVLGAVKVDARGMVQ